MVFILLGLCICLSVGIVFALIELARKDRVVVLVPPHLTGEAELVSNEADADYLKAWGLHIATVMGNVTPGNVRLARATLEPLLDPRIYSDVVARLETEISKIDRDRVTISFDARRVGLPSDDGRVVVEGIGTVTSIGGGKQKTPRTYDLQIEMKGYRPVLTDLSVYEGTAKTLPGGDGS